MTAKERKEVKMFYKMQDFTDFVNSPDIELIDWDIKVVEQSISFQESFAAIVFYKVVEVKQELTNL